MSNSSSANPRTALHGAVGEAEPSARNTPGPWSVWPSIYEGMAMAIVHDVEPLRTIAEVRKHPSAYSAALLMAAAPDLLEALKRNRAALDLIDPMRTLQYATTMDLMRRDMDAAIAKATGQTVSV